MKPTIQSIKIVSCIAFVISLTYILSIQQNKGGIPSRDSKFVSVAAIVSPTLIPAPKVLTSQMESPEGSKILTLTREETAGSVTHSVYVTTVADGSKQDILTADTHHQDLSIPYNTWSPDTVYFFLKETLADTNDYLVYMSSVEGFGADIPALSIRRFFTEQVQGFAITDVTGWASPTQIIVNTRAVDGDAKVSFWFDVPSQTFTQLSTYFK